MKPGRWACFSALIGSLALVALSVAGPQPAGAQAPQPGLLLPTLVEAVVSGPGEAADPPPAAADLRWHAVPLTHDLAGRAAWYRLRFDAVPADDSPPMLYLPYFYGGGRVLLNGQPVAEVMHGSPALRVRWERPLLLPLPRTALQAAGNQLLIRAEPAFGADSTVLPRLVLGPQRLLQPDYERRLFFVSTLPLLTWVVGSVVGLLVLFIWLQRRSEALYGLFGLAALLWAQRTSTFVLEVLPAGAWDAWRAVYHLCTGGFVVVMALFMLQLAGWQRRRLTRALVAYGALGPLIFLALGEGQAAQAWTAGLGVVGLGMAGVALAAAWRQRTLETAALAGAVLLGFVAGLHDQAVATRAGWLLGALPGWGEHRLFLLHHAANLLLLVMGVLLARRFVRSLNAVEAANRTLEARVLAREREIASNYRRIASLEREQAATDERQRIMRDLHDGLGSQLFTSLSRAERGHLQAGDMADSLRSAIDQMRVAIEALAAEEQDFEAAFGNFRCRWDARLRESGLQTRWQIELPESAAASARPLLAPHDALQLLHIIQEALTNVLKHARAQSVTVRLVLRSDGLVVDVDDDGAGLADGSSSSGRGRANMRRRAQHLAGQIEWLALPRGTRVALRAPWRPPAPA